MHKMMNEHLCVCLEEGLSVSQWVESKQNVVGPTEWGGDMEVQLQALLCLVDPLFYPR